MTLQGIKYLPVSVKKDEALSLYKSLAKVQEKLGELNSEISHSIVNKNFMQVFSLIESTQSTRIEGTQVTFTEVLEEKNTKNKSSEITEVLNYQKSLNRGIDLLKANNPISTRLMQELHRILMENSRGTVSGSGEYRKIQNHIGPDNNIENAVYIPIGAQDIGKYMANLEFFINNEQHTTSRHDFDIEDEIFDENSPGLIKTAIVHAQFESIHPFLDGNGRLGRILIILTLLKERVIKNPIFFVSEELEKERARYYDLLNGVRGEEPEWYPWIKFFLDASYRMVVNLLKKIELSEKLAEEGLNELIKDSEQKVWLYSFNSPIFTVSAAAEDLKLTQPTVRKAVDRLVSMELLYTDKVTKRNKKYHNYEVMRILNNN